MKKNNFSLMVFIISSALFLLIFPIILQAACTKDADCDDGNIYNGTENCNIITGMCQSGIMPFKTDLIAGGGSKIKSAIDVGDVLVWNDADNLYVQYIVTAPWCLTETHLQTATSLAMIPQKKGSPIPGQFDLMHKLSCEMEDPYVIPLESFNSQDLYIAAHAVVARKTQLGIFQYQTAWGAGFNFPSRNWATYFTYSIQDTRIIGWANLQWPPMLTSKAGTPTDKIYGQVWIDGETMMPGPTPGLRAQVGMGPAGTNPDGNPDWKWVEASFHVDAGNNDEFVGQFMPTEAGDFDYVYRYTLNDGAKWLYADINGPVPSGDVPPNPGKLKVLARIIGWANLQWPPMLTAVAGTPTDKIYGQAWIDGETTLPGPTPGLRAQVGMGPVGTNPDGNPDWKWVEASFHVDAGNNDEFVGQLTPSEAGDFDYVYRYTLNDGAKWLYADINGPVPSSEVPPNPGKLTVLPPLRTVTVTFNVTVPAGTPTDAIVNIAGSLSQLDGGYPDWNPNGAALTKVGDNAWTITFTGPETNTVEYKYTLGSWNFVEKGADCEEFGNRKIILDYGTNGIQTVYDTVSNWRNISPCDDMAHVTFNVTVPNGTPSDATVYIAGNLSALGGGLPDFNPGAVALTKVGDYKWTITLDGPASTNLQYRYTLGTWDFVEKGAACEEISNRQLLLTAGSQTVSDSVSNWRNIAPCGN